MKTKITLTVEIEHTKNTPTDTIEECLETGLKETLFTNGFDVTNVEFNDLEAKNKTLWEALNFLLQSYKADFRTITGSELNETMAVRQAKKALEDYPFINV